MIVLNNSPKINISSIIICKEKLIKQVDKQPVDFSKQSFAQRNDMKKTFSSIQNTIPGIKKNLNWSGHQ